MAGYIHIHVVVNGVTTLKMHINKHKTTADLFRAIRERDEMKGIRFETMVLDGNSIPESGIDTLESSGFRNNSNAYLCMSAHGGSSDSSEPDDSSPAFFRWTTKERCCVDYDDDPGVKRAKMPCGCVIGTEALKMYCKEKVGKGCFRFPCVKCDNIWPNKAASEALSAAMPDSEFESLMRKVNRNYFSGSAAFKKCPFCDAYIRRDPSRRFLNVNWVECPVCTKKKRSSVTFCWNCDKAWIGDRTSCGNSGCDGKDPRIKILQSCGTAKVEFLSVTGVPKCRACIDCGRILEHSGGCKHMSCPCGCEFCFVCLKKKVKVGDKMQWQCGTYATACSVAPRQKVIFDFQPVTKA